jgi:hypothetical protein
MKSLSADRQVGIDSRGSRGARTGKDTMLERLQRNVSQKHEEPARTTSSGRSVEGFKFNGKLKGKNTAPALSCESKIQGRERQNNGRFTLMDLIAIFTDEAEKICKNKTIANLIALESLRDYIKKNVSNIKIVL